MRWPEHMVCREAAAAPEGAALLLAEHALQRLPSWPHTLTSALTCGLCAAEGLVPHLRALPSALDEAWLQACWQIDPQDIFFATRPSGKLCRLGKGAFGTVRTWLYGSESTRFACANSCQAVHMTGCTVPRAARSCCRHSSVAMRCSASA